MATVAAPRGWSGDDESLFKDYYWTKDPRSLKTELETHYDLSDVKPLWARDSSSEGVLIIFEAKAKDQKAFSYYLWNGIADQTWAITEKSLEQVKKNIDAEKGELDKIVFKELK